MANYASLWTSGSDKEFRQMSKFHSLERRRLGLQIAGIQREHARHVKRVRVEIREAGTLVHQYEKEKEERARHLLRIFSKVQKRRQATQSWKTAHERRRSSVAPSVTFDVEIGDENAPWAGSTRRRDSKESNFSRRKSSTSSLNSLKTPSKSRSSAGSLFGGKVVRISSPSRQYGLSGSMKISPPFDHHENGPHNRKGAPYLLTSWQTAALAQRKEQHRENNDQAATKEDEDDIEPADQKTFFSKGTGRKSSGTLTKKESDKQVKRRQVFWTETFPYVYHSVGETVCPRYKLFLQYDEFKVHPLQKKTQRKRSSAISSLSMVTDPESMSESVPGSSRSSFRVAEAMTVFRRMSDMSLSD